MVISRSKGKRKAGFVLTVAQIEWLDSESRRLEISKSEFMRRLVDEARGER